jgi:ribosome-associated protein
MIKKKSNSDVLVKLIVAAIEDKKGENIKALDLRKLGNAVTDFFVICEAQSSPQIHAIFQSIDEKVKKTLGEDPYQVEGLSENYWVLMDYVNVVVHILKPEARSFYRLEALWADAKYVKL